MKPYHDGENKKRKKKTKNEQGTLYGFVVFSANRAILHQSYKVINFWGGTNQTKRDAHPMVNNEVGKFKFGHELGKIPCSVYARYFLNS